MSKRPDMVDINDVCGSDCGPPRVLRWFECLEGSELEQQKLLPACMSI